MAMTGAQRVAKWRAAGGLRVNRVAARANCRAARWVRDNYPDVWADMLEQSERDEAERDGAERS